MRITNDYHYWFLLSNNTVIGYQPLKISGSNSRIEYYMKKVT